MLKKGNNFFLLKVNFLIHFPLVILTGIESQPEINISESPWKLSQIQMRVSKCRRWLATPSEKCFPCRFSP